MSAILPTFLASYLGQEWALTDAHRTLVHYVGEHTCTVRIDATVVHQDDHQRQTITLFEKTYYNEEGEENFRVMRQLWQSEARSSGRLVIARPIWHDSSLKTFWQLGLNGIPFDACDVYSPAFLPSFEEAARRLAALHVTPITCARSTTVADLIADLKRVTPALIRLRPSCGPALSPLVAHLLAQAERMPEEPRATLHGDLHLGNLFVNDGCVALIDLDNVRTGPPLLDLGSLIAGLHYVRILRKASPESCHRLVERFLQTYQANVPWTVLPPLLNWYVAVTLITERANRCLTRLKEGRPAMVEELIALAGRLSQDSASCEH
ncbi:MAG: Stress response kinase A [Nitrospira sp.]|nr:Stress response kinase A [Nitrospira sp.]